jgi:hypothetical protein
MVKGIVLAALLVTSMVAFGGCRLAAPALESVGGAECGPSSVGPSKTQMILRQWGRDQRSNERFVDNYFLNYDVNDPYRGDCLAGY